MNGTTGGRKATTHEHPKAIHSRESHSHKIQGSKKGASNRTKDTEALLDLSNSKCTVVDRCCHAGHIEDDLLPKEAMGEYIESMLNVAVKDLGLHLTLQTPCLPSIDHSPTIHIQPSWTLRTMCENLKTAKPEGVIWVWVPGKGWVPIMVFEWKVPKSAGFRGAKSRPTGGFTPQLLQGLTGVQECSGMLQV